jgi:hypothetical protein
MLKVIGTTDFTGETIVFDPYVLITIMYDYPLGKSVFWYAQDVIDSITSKNGIVTSCMNSYIEVWLQEDSGALHELKIILMDEKCIEVTDGQFHTSSLPAEQGVPLCDVSWVSRAGDVRKENLAARMEIGKDNVRLIFGEAKLVKRYLAGSRVQYGVDENDYLCRIELNHISPVEMTDLRKYLAWKLDT